jgi:hypothetical protein
MMKHIATALLLALALAAGPAAAQQFSADLVMTGTNRTTTQKLYVADGKIRIEVPEGATVMIADTAANTGYMLMTKQKVYIDAGATRGMTQMFMLADADDPCPQWKKMSEEMAQRSKEAQDHALASCTRAGTETVDGRSTVKYDTVSTKGEKSSAWIDPKLKFLVKAQGQRGGIELKNIQEGPQAANLFTLPAGYKKMDMRQMMQQHMQQQPQQ